MRRDFVAVTGAAGTLGRATAATLMKAGYAIIGIDRTAEIPGSDALALTLGGIDLTCQEESSAAFAHIAREIGSLHALVNIAGGFAWESIENAKLDTWERLYKMNVGTALNCCKAALPLLLANGGAIVNVSAMATHNAQSGMGAYAAAKSGVSRLTESRARLPLHYCPSPDLPNECCHSPL
jgi:NAD(P)-dependent dehydrogenase (short-subunit alcohol dehydrogenase family)